MSWRSVAMVVVGIFSLGTIAALIAPVVVQIVTSLLATGNYDGKYLTEGMATGLIGTWFNTVIFAMFGLMLVALAWVLRKELTRGGL